MNYNNHSVSSLEAEGLRCTLPSAKERRKEEKKNRRHNKPFDSLDRPKKKKGTRRTDSVLILFYFILIGTHMFGSGVITKIFT